MGTMAKLTVLVFLGLALMATCVFAQAKVVIVKEETYTKRELVEWLLPSHEDEYLYLKVTVKNVGEKDAENVIIGYDCQETSQGYVCCIDSKHQCTKVDKEGIIRYLGKQDKESVEIKAGRRTAIRRDRLVTDAPPRVTAKVISYETAK